MSEQWECTERTFVVTGGASGLGALNVECFLRDGAKKVAILDVAEDKGIELRERLNKSYHGKVYFYKCDMSDEEQVSLVFTQVVDEFERVDAIVNNAGVFDDSPDRWRKACDINWQGVVSLTLKGIKHMRADRGGRGGTIINVSSVTALIRFPYMPVYCGSKAAVLHFSQAIAMDPFYEKTGIRVLVMCYGGTDTPLLSGLHGKAWDSVLGEGITKMVAPALPVQSAESAAAATHRMYRDGTNGSIWVAINNNGGKDITSIVNDSYTSFENYILRQS